MPRCYTQDLSRESQIPGERGWETRGRDCVCGREGTGRSKGGAFEEEKKTSKIMKGREKEGLDG